MVDSNFLLKTFWMQSTQLVSTAAPKPSAVNDSSVAEHSTRPVTTGSSDRFTWQSKSRHSRRPSWAAADAAAPEGGPRGGATDE